MCTHPEIPTSVIHDRLWVSSSAHPLLHSFVPKQRLKRMQRAKGVWGQIPARRSHHCCVQTCHLENHSVTLFSCATRHPATVRKWKKVVHKSAPPRMGQENGCTATLECAEHRFRVRCHCLQRLLQRSWHPRAPLVDQPLERISTQTRSGTMIPVILNGQPNHSPSCRH